MPDRNIETAPKKPGNGPKVAPSRWASMRKFMATIATTVTAVFAKRSLKGK